MNKATVVALQGDLGAGKTYFVQNVGRMMGVKEHITSPTFVIMNIYDIEPTWHKFKKFIHIDAYRIEKKEELLNLGWEKLLDDSENIIFVEWPERVEGLIPKESKKLIFNHAK